MFQIGRKQMIEGWEKGLLNMCVGEKRKLVVPSDMVSLFVCSLDFQCMNLSKLQALTALSSLSWYRHMVLLVVLAQSR